MGTESWILTLSIVLFVAFVAAGFLADSFPLQPWIRTLRRWIRFAFFSLALALAAKKYFLCHRVVPLVFLFISVMT